MIITLVNGSGGGAGRDGGKAQPGGLEVNKAQPGRDGGKAQLGRDGGKAQPGRDGSK